MNMMYIKKTNSDSKKIAVIGGGAAGMMAAAKAAELGAHVTLFEKNDRLGKKLRITGKGRCNVTNDCTRDEFFANVPRNPRFLYASFSNFSTEDTKIFFEEAGVPLKTERGKRVFPVSDRAQDIVSAMQKKCLGLGCEILYKKVKGIKVDGGRACGIITADAEYDFDAIILATGGKSYPLTGSDGDGYRMARTLGHNVTELVPSLVPIVEDGRISASMQGLSLKNIKLSVLDNKNGKVVFEDFGELMFTHFGLTGPLVLSASAHLRDIDKDRYTAEIDLKPALDEKKLDARLISDLARSNNKDFINSLGGLLPQKMIETVVRLSGIDGRKKCNSVTKEERKTLLRLLKHFRIPLLKFRPIEEAIITSGGIDVKEISPKTMESKLIKGLYFAGEIIDVDAYTGGFNLQIAFSTAALAGESAALNFDEV
ncbi:MAG: NAD(P)/FAD-dependent oxidoreductase [Clostridia bacterium]|nr:NAD(P)/FAD-dependent oxidoreductase [Clostridia bacterium]